MTLEVSEREIARVAYELWEAEGRPEGRAVEHWLAAEARLRNAEGMANTTKQQTGSHQASGAKQKRGIRYGLVLHAKMPRRQDPQGGR